MAEPPDCGKKPKKSSSRAQYRRNTEGETFYELAKLLPLTQENTMKQDKLSVLRLTLAYMKFRQMLEQDDAEDYDSDFFSQGASRAESEIPLCYDPKAPLKDDETPVAMLDGDSNVVAGALDRHRPVLGQVKIKLPDDVVSKLEQEFLSDNHESPEEGFSDARMEKLRRYTEGLERGMQEFLNQGVTDIGYSSTSKSESRENGSKASRAKIRSAKESTPGNGHQDMDGLEEFNSGTVQRTQQSVLGVLDSEESTLMLQASPGFFIALGHDKRILYVSENVSEFLGHYQSYFIGQDVTDFVYEKDLPELQALMDESQFNEGDSCRIKNVQTRRTFYVALNFCFQKPGSRSKDCGYALYQWNARLCLSREKLTGKVRLKGLISVCRPMHTDTVLAFQTNGNSFLIRYDLSMKILYCDPKFEELTGYQPKDLIGVSGYTFKHPCDVLMCEYNHRRLLQDGHGHSGYYRVISRMGSWVWVYSQLQLKYDRHGKPQFLTMRTFLISPGEAERVMSREKRDYERMKCIGFGIDLSTRGPTQPTLATASAAKELRRKNSRTSTESGDSNGRFNRVREFCESESQYARQKGSDTKSFTSASTESSMSPTESSSPKESLEGHSFFSTDSSESEHNSCLKEMSSRSSSSGCKGGVSKKSKKSGSHKRRKLLTGMNDSSDEPQSMNFAELDGDIHDVMLDQQLAQDTTFDEPPSVPSYTDLMPCTSESFTAAIPSSKTTRCESGSVLISSCDPGDNLPSSTESFPPVTCHNISEPSQFLQYTPLGIPSTPASEEPAGLTDLQGNCSSTNSTDTSCSYSTHITSSQVSDAAHCNNYSSTAEQLQQPVPSDAFSDSLCTDDVSLSQVLFASMENIDSVSSASTFTDMLNSPSMVSSPCSQAFLNQSSGDIMLSSTAYVTLTTPIPTRQRQIFQIQSNIQKTASTSGKSCTDASNLIEINNCPESGSGDTELTSSQKFNNPTSNTRESPTEVGNSGLQPLLRSDFTNEKNLESCSHISSSTSTSNSQTLSSRVNCEQSISSTSSSQPRQLSECSDPHSKCGSLSDCLDCQMRHQRKCLAGQNYTSQINSENALASTSDISWKNSCQSAPSTYSHSLSETTLSGNSSHPLVKTDVIGKRHDDSSGQQSQTPDTDLTLPDDLLDLELDDSIMNDLDDQNWVKYL